MLLFSCLFTEEILNTIEAKIIITVHSKSDSSDSSQGPQVQFKR